MAKTPKLITKLIPLTYETHRVRIGMKGQRTFDPTKLLHPEVFIRTDNARDLRKGRVKKLTKVLMENSNFSGVWLVNQKGKKLRNIDCNHRYDAVIDFFAYCPDAEIEVELHLYHDLTEDEERKEFSKSNNSAGQTVSDYLQQYKKTLNIWEYINNEYVKSNFPIKVSHKSNPNKKVMALHNLFQCYVVRDEMPYRGSFQGSAISFIEELQSWNSGKYGLNGEGYLAFNTIRAFLKDYTIVVGQYTLTSKYWKPSIFQPMFRIWYDNKTSLPIDKLRNALKGITYGVGLGLVQQYANKGASRANVEQLILEFLDELNGSKKRNRLYIRHVKPGIGEVKRYGWASYSI